LEQTVTKKPLYLASQCGSVQLGSSSNSPNWTVPQDYWHKTAMVPWGKPLPTAPLDVSVVTQDTGGSLWSLL